MRAQPAVNAQAPDTPAFEGLRFFDGLLPERTPPAARQPGRTRPGAGGPLRRRELPPDTKECTKLSALEAVLVYHKRQRVFDIKVIDFPQAVVGDISSASSNCGAPAA